MPVTDDIYSGGNFLPYSIWLNGRVSLEHKKVYWLLKYFLFVELFS
jgi:hypothetical protein